MIQFLQGYYIREMAVHEDGSQYRLNDVSSGRMYSLASPISEPHSGL